MISGVRCSTGGRPAEWTGIFYLSGIGRSGSVVEMIPERMIRQIRKCEKIESARLCIFHLNAQKDRGIRMLGESSRFG